MAVANYHDNNGHLPPPYQTGRDGRPWHSWRVLILPFIEQHALHKEYNFEEPWDGPNNRRLADRMPSVYTFHAGVESGGPTTNYVAVVGPETAWPEAGRRRFADATDGRNQTILIVENLGAGIHWMEPRDLRLADMDLRVNSPGGVSSPYTRPGVAMCDGGLSSLDPNLDPDVLRALLTVAGGEKLTEGGAGGWEFLPDGRDRPLQAP